MASKLVRDLRFVGAVTLAGVISGGITANLSMVYFDGCFFGVMLAFALAISEITDRLWKLPCVVALTTVAFFMSFLWMFATAFQLPGGNFSQSTVSPYSLFVAGMTGGIIVVGGTLLLINPKIWFRPLMFRVSCRAVLGGILGVIGWAMGPSLGPWVAPLKPWEVHAGYTAFEDTPLHHYALYVVWQAGMACAVGVSLLDYLPAPGRNELKLK